MNTNHHTEPIQIILKDGNMQLAAWTQAIAPIPALGDSIEIPDHLQRSLQGYETHAAVSRIVRKDAAAYRLHLEARCVLTQQQRPVVVLNSNRVPEAIRPRVEAYLRRIFRLPVIEWEAGQQSEPILRFHEPSTGRKTILPALQAKIRGLIPALQMPGSAEIHS